MTSRHEDQKAPRAIEGLFGVYPMNHLKLIVIQNQVISIWIVLRVVEQRFAWTVQRMGEPLAALRRKM